jgi:membrane-bound ClpP family serine protease
MSSTAHPGPQFLNTPAKRPVENSIKVSTMAQNSRPARTTLLLESARSRIGSRSARRGWDVLGIIAAVLIVLWLLGFFAFHVTAGLIHIVLVVGLILLVLHFVRRA